MVFENIQEFQNTYCSYTDALEYKYTIAWDKNAKGIKWYGGFNSFLEYEDFINKSNKIKTRVFYEVLGKECKAYFDFDKLDTTKEQLNIFIDNFIGYLNELFNINISINELLIYTRTEEDPNKIDSVHISIINYKFTQQDLKKAVKYFKFVMTDDVIEKMDDKIYSKNRLFNLPNNTKLKYLKQDNTNPKYFIDYKTQSKEAKDILITYTDELPKIEIDNTKLFINEIIQDLFNSTIDIVNKKLEEQTPILEEQRIRQRIININEPIDIFDLLIFELEKSFYSNGKDWKHITLLFKKFGITHDQFNKWNKQSVKNTKYTLEQNKTYYNKLDIFKCKSGKKIFKEIIERHLNITINFNSNNKLAVWLFNKINGNNEYTPEFYDNSLNEINSIIDNENSKIFYIGEYEYDTVEGFLVLRTTDGLKINKNIVGNYFVEVDYKKLAEESSINKKILLENIEDITPYISDFNKNKQKSIISVKAKWSSGKTQIITRNIIQYGKNKYRVIFLTENNSLNKQLVKQFSTEDNIFISHIKTAKGVLNKQETDEEDNEKIINIVCSIESIQKIKFKETDILILDEYESIINHFESETFNNQNFEKFMLFKSALIKVNKIVMLDADISNERLKIIERITNIETKTFHILTNNFKEYSFNYYNNANSFKTNYENDLNNNNKLIFPSSSKNYINRLYTDFIVKYPNKNIMKLTSEGVQVNNDAIITKAELLDNLEEIIINNNIDIFLHSPSIKTGISINTEYFNKCYAYGSSKSLCSREFIQMFFRARQLKDKSINISVNGKIKRAKPYVKISNIERYLIDPVYLLQTFKLFEPEVKQSFDDEKITEKEIDYESIIKFDKDYLLTKITNLYENHNSKTRFTQDLLTRLIHSHNIPINFIDYQEEQEEEQVEQDQEEQEEQLEQLEEKDKEIITSEFTQSRLLTPKEYLDTNHKKNWLEISKYKFFYQKYFIKGITDKLEYDKYIYDTINTYNFYNKYTVKEEMTKYMNLKIILNNDIEKIKSDLTPEINYKKQTENTFTDYEHKKGLQIILIKLIAQMKLNINELPLKMSNAEFETIVKGFSGFQNDLKIFFDTYTIEHTHKFDFNDKNYIIHIKRAIIDLLEKVNIKFKYVNKNTAGKNDKFTIYLCNVDNHNKKYIGRLNQNDMRIHKNLIKKTKNTFKYNDKKAYSTNNENYYTTYEVKINKKVKAISLTIESNNETLLTNWKKVLISIMEHKQHRPLLISEVDYNKIINNNIDKLNN